MRNDMIFNGKVFDSRQIIDLVELRIASWAKVKWLDYCISMMDAIRYLVEKPPIDSLKFNVDGSSKSKLGPAGIGGVLKDCSAKVKVVFSEAVGLVDLNVTELIAVSEALCIFS
ncbi:hypothetical protein CRYUN_Cryun01aG0003800 [Craigia yunnanensis]